MASMNEEIIDSEMDNLSRTDYFNDKIAELKTDDSNLEKLFDLMLDMNDRLEQQEEEMRRLRDSELQEVDRRSNNSSRCSTKPPKLHTVARAAPMARQNMSFTNQKAKEIEKENHRLLAEIQRKKQKPKIKKPQSRKSVITTPATPPARVTASLVNRRRDAERIQFENLLLLKRLQKAKPTETIRKSTNITRSRPTTATRNTNGSKKRSSSADARPNRERTNTDTNRSSSAKNSKSNKSKNKPVWEAGW